MNAIDLMNEIGMKKAVSKIDSKIKMCEKLSTAYNNFEFIDEDGISSFQERLKKDTTVIVRNGKVVKKVDPSRYQELKYDTLVFNKLSDYEKTPPMDCLIDIKKAQGLGCFDYYEVAEVISVVEVVDPVVFGRIKGCSDRFFITQWDDDVKWEDLKKFKNEIKLD